MSDQQQQPPANPTAAAATTALPLPFTSLPPGQQQQQQQRRPPSSAAVRSAAIQVNESSGVPFGHVPAYLPGSSSLVEELDKRILIVLRDGKHVIGTLASFDQFSNLVLLDTIERRMVQHANGRCFCHDTPLGIFLVRGDAVVLLGQVATNIPGTMEWVESAAELERLRATALPPRDWNFDGDLIA